MNGRYLFLPVWIVLGALIILPAAATDVTGPLTISSPGIYNLTTDLTNRPETAVIVVATSNVVFDGGGHMITGGGGENGFLTTGGPHTNITVKNTRFSGWHDAIVFSQVSGGTIAGCSVQDNSRFGIYLRNSAGNSLTSNTVTGSGVWGINLEQMSHANRVTNCTIRGNPVGIRVQNSEGNRIYNNYFQNVLNAGFCAPVLANSWNAPQTVTGPNIIGGPYIAGNYWALPNGKGFSQKARDRNGDGISDRSYTMITGNTDQSPLAGTSPKAKFTAKKVRGAVPYQYSFTDRSKNGPNSWQWNFGDGASSTVKSPVHIFPGPGSYLTILTVTNGLGTSSASKVVRIRQAR